MARKAYVADRLLPVPIVNYAVNPSFEDGDTGLYTLTSTYVGWTRGWGAQKGTAGDTVTITNSNGNPDTAYGGLRCARMVKSGSGTGHKIIQAVPLRILRRLYNRQFTVGIRVACTSVNIVRLALFINGAYTYSSLNTKNDGTYETLSITIPAGGTSSSNSLAFGLDWGGSGTGNVDIDSVFLVDGAIPPSPLQYAVTPQTNGCSIWDGWQASADPKCVRIFGNGNFWVLPYNVTTLAPFNQTEVDTDRMGLTNGRITINTDGRYFVSWGLLSSAASVAGTDWYSYVARAGGSVPFRGSTASYPLSAAYHNAAPYISTQGSFIEDFIAGDYLEVYGYAASGGGTITVHYNDTYFQAIRLGD